MAILAYSEMLSLHVEVAANEGDSMAFGDYFKLMRDDTAKPSFTGMTGVKHDYEQDEAESSNDGKSSD